MVLKWLMWESQFCSTSVLIRVLHGQIRNLKVFGFHPWKIFLPRFTLLWWWQNFFFSPTKGMDLDNAAAIYAMQCLSRRWYKAWRVFWTLREKPSLLILLPPFKPLLCTTLLWYQQSYILVAGAALIFFASRQPISILTCILEGLS